MLASVITGIAILMFGNGGSFSSSHHTEKQQQLKKENVQFLPLQHQLQQRQLNDLQDSVDQLRMQQQNQQIQQGYDAMNRNSSGSWISPNYSIVRRP